MRECITIHIGQAGIQSGNACWCPTGFKCGINYQPPTVVGGPRPKIPWRNG